MEEHDAVKNLAALAHPARLRVFRALVVAGPEGLTPGHMVADMAADMAVSATALSFHLKELMSVGLVTQERAGRYLHYRAAFDRMNALLAYLTAHCCQGAACLETEPPTCHC